MRLVHSLIDKHRYQMSPPLTNLLSSLAYRCESVYTRTPRQTDTSGRCPATADPAGSRQPHSLGLAPLALAGLLPLVRYRDHAMLQLCLLLPIAHTPTLADEAPGPHCPPLLSAIDELSETANDAPGSCSRRLVACVCGGRTGAGMPTGGTMSFLSPGVLSDVFLADGASSLGCCCCCWCCCCFTPGKPS